MDTLLDHATLSSYLKEHDCHRYRRLNLLPIKPFHERFKLVGDGGPFVEYGREEVLYDPGLEVRRLPDVR